MNTGGGAGIQRNDRDFVLFPRPSAPIDDGHYYIDTDASEVAIAGFLHQEQPWDTALTYRSIAYGSKAMSPEQQKYCSIDFLREVVRVLSR